MSDAVLDPFATSPDDPNADQVLDPYPKAGRRVKLAVTWESKGIARDLAPHLKSLTYIDNLTSAADDLTFEVEDRDRLWSGDWAPEFGDEVVARAEAEGWFGFGDPVTSLRLGKFSHDKIGIRGRVVRLQCVSAPLATALRRRKRTRTWRGATLKQIAQDIADRAELTLGFSGAEGPKYKPKVQNNKSDLEFLEELTKEVGRTLKVTETSIQIFEERELDGRPSVGEIDFDGGKVFSQDAAFDSDDNGRYGSCHVTSFNPRTGKTIKGEFPRKGQVVEGLDPNGQTLELVIGVQDEGQAAARAEALLRNANRFGMSGMLPTVGDLGLVAGITFDLVNAQKFDGKYMITRAVHHLVGGYTCELTVRRCLEGY